VSPAVQQTLALARRSIRGTFRFPQAWFPSLFFPLVLMAIFTASFGRSIAHIPGFPKVDGFLSFAVTGAIVQGVLISAVGAGGFFAADIEGGFFDRLVSSPAARSAILVSRLVASMVLAVCQATFFLGIALAFGATIKGGVVGAMIVIVLAGLLAIPIGGLGVLLALRTGSAEAVQGMFPLFFALMFFSSTFFPRETMTGWFQQVANWNPISHLVEGMRAQVIIGVDWSQAGISLAIIIGLAVLTVGGSVISLRRRLEGNS
jgi:ABC-2 type transport system permease protein